MIDKQIVFTQNMEINYFANNELLAKTDDNLFNLAYTFQTEDVEKVLYIFSLKSTCIGGPNKIDYPGIQ